jgi:BirA family biotin operon repressor/biotin-[acetyl-CoA-carboxylase] ligase
MTGDPQGPLPSLPQGCRLAALDNVTSTMDEARRLAEEGAAAWTFVWAREQSAGRGRLARNWDSPRGNLYLSILLRPDCPAVKAAQYGLLAALAIGDAIAELAPPLAVTYKWPNDVLVDGRKVAGILLESRSQSDGSLTHLILGCGVNLASHPEATTYPATSLHHEGLAAEITEVEVLEAFARHFRSWSERWTRDGFAAARSAWLGRAQSLGQEIQVRLPDRSLVGVFRDLDAEGFLVLETADGHRERISSGDVFPLN